MIYFFQYRLASYTDVCTPTDGQVSMHHDKCVKVLLLCNAGKFRPF